VTLVFGLTTPAGGVEFRGYDVGNHSVYFDYVAVRQVLPQPVTQLMFSSDNMGVEKGTVSDGVIVHSTGAGAGTCWYGPYTSLPKGSYTAKFWLKLDQPYNGTLLDIGVTTNYRQTLAAKLTVSGLNFTSVGTWQSFDVNFTLPNDSNSVEFPGFNARELAPFSFLFVEVYPTELTFNYNKMYVVKGAVSDGVIVHSTGAGAGTCWYGPYASLLKGNYTARFWLRLDQPYNGTLLDIGVTANNGQTLVTKLTVSGSDFTSVGTWQSFDVNFTLPNDSNSVEFPGFNVREGAPFSFLFVEVYPDSGG
jgi:hypothetical protein